MNIVTIGDRDIEVDDAVAAELGRLRAEAAIRDAARPVVVDGVRLLSDAREALMAQQARNNDPSTAQGAYRERLRNAYRNPPVGAHG